MLSHARMGACLLAAAVGTLLTAQPAIADCAAPATKVFPNPSDELPTNARIVIDMPSRAGSGGTLPAPAMELRAATERIALTLVETNTEVVYRSVRQMVLVPARELL